MSLKSDLIQELYNRKTFVEEGTLNFLMSSISARSLNKSFNSILKPFNPDDVSLDRGEVLDYMVKGPTTIRQINNDLFGRVGNVNYHIIKLLVHQYAEIDGDTVKLTDKGMDLAQSLEPAEQAA